MPDASSTERQRAAAGLRSALLPGDAPRAPGGVGQPIGRRDLLRWLYVGRLTLVTGIFAGALRAWFAARPEDTFLATVMFLAAFGFTSWSFWYTHVLSSEPGENFLYAQVVLDVTLVTGIVHVTGGPDSNFAPLYILVISAGALLLPLAGGALIGALASMVYLGDLVWGYEGAFDLGVALQIALFAVVALITGLLGDRLRRAGTALGAVESELRQLRLDTDDILANLVTGVLTVDGSGRLAYANPAAEALLGFDSRPWLGRPAVEEVERVAPGMGRVLDRAIREGRPAHRFRTVTQRDGRPIHLGITTAILERGDGEPPSVTAIFQDITDQERLDALRRRAERLEAVAELSASLAHEIKNPLASIRSAVEQLSRSTLSEADRGVLERLVLGESDRLSRLLSEFLEYSGLRLGTRRRVDLDEVARECVEVVRRHPDAAGVRVDCEGVGRPLPVHGDADLLHRALFNLLLNGVQHAGPGGWVRVRLADDAHRPNPRGTPIARPVCFAVRDSGPGVDDEALARIFDPFFTTREGGSGLGLAVVYRAVEAHDGAIFVDRPEGGGTEFVVYLPGGGEGAREEP